jgi:hypothetical protein
MAWCSRGVSVYWLQAVQGLVIVSAILLDQIRKQLQGWQSVLEQKGIVLCFNVL